MYRRLRVCGRIAADGSGAYGIGRWILLPYYAVLEAACKPDEEHILCRIRLLGRVIRGRIVLQNGDGIRIPAPSFIFSFHFQADYEVCPALIRITEGDSVLSLVKGGSIEGNRGAAHDELPCIGVGDVRGLVAVVGQISGAAVRCSGDFHTGIGDPHQLGIGVVKRSNDIAGRGALGRDALEAEGKCRGV